MNFKKAFLVLCLVVAGSFGSVYAQTVLEKHYSDEIFITAGLNAPMHKYFVSGPVYGIHYGHSYLSGIGFRAGVQYSPDVAQIDDVLGFPVAFTYRTRSLSWEERFINGINGIDNAVKSVSTSRYIEYNRFGDVILGFLSGLFDRVEFFAGVTPGYNFAGSSSLGIEYTSVTETTRWVEKPTSLYLLLDAGFNLNFKIWRFDLKLMPAFHFNVLNSYVYHSETKDLLNGSTMRQTGTLRWFFTLSGGIGLHFAPDRHVKMVLHLKWRNRITFLEKETPGRSRG